MPAPSPATRSPWRPGSRRCGSWPRARPTRPLRARLRGVTADLGTLVTLCAALLAWAGLVEAFLSQYHAPVLPYGLKIVFGAIEAVALGAFLARAGGRES